MWSFVKKNEVSMTRDNFSKTFKTFTREIVQGLLTWIYNHSTNSGCTVTIFLSMFYVLNRRKYFTTETLSPREIL